MQTLAWTVLAAGIAAGCATDGDDDLPIIPQGGTPTVGGSRTPNTFTSRVCRADDLQDLTRCTTTTNNAGLSVTLEGTTTTTATDGTFTLPLPGANATNLAIDVAGPGVIPTTFPVSNPFTGVGSVPVVDADLFARTLTSNNISLDPVSGSLLVNVTRDGVPASGITMTSSPMSAFGPFYDVSSPVTWGLGGTSTRGVILAPGLTAGMVDLSFNHIAGGLTTNVAGIPIRNGGVTILDTVLPGTIP